MKNLKFLSAAAGVAAVAALLTGCATQPEGGETPVATAPSDNACPRGSVDFVSDRNPQKLAPTTLLAGPQFLGEAERYSSPEYKEAGPEMFSDSALVISPRGAEVQTFARDLLDGAEVSIYKDLGGSCELVAGPSTAIPGEADSKVVYWTIPYDGPLEEDTERGYLMHVEIDGEEFTGKVFPDPWNPTAEFGHILVDAH
ncbi:MAG: hypothetical protein ACTH34_03090 [Microbacterium gubbeenense]|uniref:hypothetical protein n=1 Tax=Microbacterium gubbeenense TaxID=159896 RepID=UPI003F9BC9FA